MSLIQSIRNKLAAAREYSCGCGEHKRVEDGTKTITKDMIVRDVVAKHPQTVRVFGNHKVDFCCGGAHSIEQTAQARGCPDIDALVADLNTSIQ